MDLGVAGLSEQPFRTHGTPLVTVAYRSHQAALETLADSCAAVNGLCLLQGPALSGKTTLIRAFVGSLPEERSVAVVDGNGLDAANLLTAVLGQFGYVIADSSTSELMAMLRVFAMQQAALHEAPILIIENTHALNPKALGVLCELAKLSERGKSALKIILASDRPLQAMIKAPAMETIASRLSHDIHLRPMTDAEAVEYLHLKLREAGSIDPECLLPKDVCTELWMASGGWPGILDRIALLSLAQADSPPVTLDQIERPALPKGTWSNSELATVQRTSPDTTAAPSLFISRDGEVLDKFSFNKSRILIGRSEHNDIPITSKFISRHHAMIVRHKNATFLMDLNSTNGTLVNSRRVSNHVLIHDDVITLGHHHLKFDDPHSTQRLSTDSMDIGDTAIMKTLGDMRQLLAQENTELLPAITENLPTSGV